MDKSNLTARLAELNAEVGLVAEGTADEVIGVTPEDGTVFFLVIEEG